jgi:hypothetical protein
MEFSDGKCAYLVPFIKLSVRCRRPVSLDAGGSGDMERGCEGE